jgi:hypothetical protein
VVRLVGVRPAGLGSDDGLVGVGSDDGLGSDGVEMVGVATWGVVSWGVVTGPTVTDGTVTEGTVADGTLSVGTVTEGADDVGGEASAGTGAVSAAASSASGVSSARRTPGPATRLHPLRGGVDIGPRFSTAPLYSAGTAPDLSLHRTLAGQRVRTSRRERARPMPQAWNPGRTECR